MKKSRFTDSQIVAIFKQVEVGTPVADLCRPLPRIWHEQRQFLPMAVEIRRNGRIADAAPQRAGG